MGFRLKTRIAAFAALLALAAVQARPAEVGTEVGQEAPFFDLRDTAGGRTQLGQFVGSPLVIVFYRGLF